jgi:predicted metal-dependent HD superfamily phosphohydrolase
MTRDHRAPAGDENAQLFLDGDLWILGAVPELYREYCTAIRKEHAWVGDCDFYQARRSILIGFLNRPKIYGSEFFQVNGFEASACANITAEIAQIDDILRTLPS